jgi:DNA-binding NarL/FixJ family response regulator
LEKIKVVSVDDHPLIHEAIRSLMADHQNMELVAEGYVGDHVFSLVEEHRPNVLILDLMMPAHENSQQKDQTFSPVPALERLVEEYPDTAIIILSQFLHKTIAQSAIDHGVRGYLLKSDNLSLNLPVAIEQVNKGGVYFSLEFSQELFSAKGPPPNKLLTVRQRETILAIAKNPDQSYSQIADGLGIAERTVKGHLNNAYRALEVSNITACIIRCMQLGLIPFGNDGVGITFRDL